MEDAFPHVPAGQKIGSMDGARFMQGYNDVTLRGIARGRAGEPVHVIDMAKAILEDRHGAPKFLSYPPNVETAEDRRLFETLLRKAKAASGHRSERHAAKVRLEMAFGYKLKPGEDK